MKIERTDALNDIYQDARSIRQAVFVGEQGINPQLEFDGTDGQATHYVVYVQNQPVAIARATVTDHGVHIQRVATLAAFRHRGYAKNVLQAILDDERYAGQTRFYLGAQQTAVGLYQTLGFRQFGQPFMEVGIRHVNMVLNR